MKGKIIKITVLVAMILIFVSALMYEVKHMPIHIKGNTGYKPVVMADGVKLSDDIFIAIDYDVCGYGPILECMPGKLIFYTNGDVILQFEGKNIYKENVKDFDKVMEQIDIEKLMTTDPESAIDALDGASWGYYFYDEEGEVVCRNVGYCPQNDAFREPCRILFRSINEDYFDSALENARRGYGRRKGIPY